MNRIEEGSVSAAAPRTRCGAVRVFIAEDHHITLWGLQRLVESAVAAMRVVGTASTRSELLAHPALDEADVLLLDLDLGGEDSAEALAEVRQRTSAHVLVLTGADEVALHRNAIVRGARGVLHKAEPAEMILRAIEKVSAGEIWVNRMLLGEVLGQLSAAAAAPPPRQVSPEQQRIATLTPREREIVVTLIGRPDAKLLVVADALRMSENTLRNHLTTIYEKLCVRGRLELHLFATQHGVGLK